MTYQTCHTDLNLETCHNALVEIAHVSNSENAVFVTCHMSLVFLVKWIFPNSHGFIYRCFVIAGKLLGTPLATPHKVRSWKDEFFLEKKVGHFHGLAYLEILLASFLHKYFPRCDVQTMDLCGCSTGTQFGVHCWDSHVLFWFGFTCACTTSRDVFGWRCLRCYYLLLIPGGNFPQL